MSALPQAREAAAGAANDLDRLYRTEAPRLARYFKGMARGSDDVADLAQDNFAQFWASATDIPRERPAAFLCGSHAIC